MIAGVSQFFGLFLLGYELVCLCDPFGIGGRRGVHGIDAVHEPGGDSNSEVSNEGSIIGCPRD